MNRRRHCALATLFAMMGMWAGGAHGQPAPGGGAAAPPAAAPPKPAAPAAPATTFVPSPPAPVTIPPAAYTSPQSNVAAITAFVTPNVANLLNDQDPGGQTKSRDNLIAATLQAGAPASPGFLFEYGRALNGAFVPVLTSKAGAPQLSLRGRLNVGIVVARVAAAAENITLAPSATLLVNDPAEPVILWGLKAAKPLIPQLLKMKGAGGPPPLVAAIAPAVLNHPSAVLVQEAYMALDLPDPAAMSELVKIWGNRLAQYPGKEPPEDPSVDGYPISTIATREMWKSVLNNPKEQARAMQLVADQTSLAAQWADKIATGEKHDQLVRLVQRCAAACQVVGQTVNDKGLVDASQPLVTLKLDGVGGVGNVGQMVPPATNLVTAIQAAFPTVKPPPTLGGPPAGAGVAGQP
jgi:hypothetical protein